MMPFIEIYHSDNKTEKAYLSKSSLIAGSSDENDINIKESGIAPHHAHFSRDNDGRWIIKNLDPDGRTFLNDKPILSHRLDDNDIFYLGSTKVQFHDPTGLSANHQDQQASQSNLAIPKKITRAPHPASSPLSEQPPADDQMGFFEPPHPQQHSHPINLHSLLRYKISAILTFLLITIPLLLLIWTYVVPMYKAVGEIRVRPIIPRLVFNTEDNGMIPLYKSFMNTQVAVMLNPGILKEVLNEKNIKNSYWMNHPEPSLLKKELKPIERLMKSLSVMPRPSTEIIGVSIMTQKPQDASHIVNAVLDKYMEYIRAKATQSHDEIYKRLKKEYNSLRSDIEKRQQTTMKLKAKLLTSSPEELVSRKRSRVESLQAQLEDLQRKITTTEWQINILRELPGKKSKLDKNNSQNITPKQQARYELDPDWRKLYLNLQTLKHNLALAAETLGKSHPKIITMKKNIEFAKELLKMKEVQLDQEPVIDASLSGNRQSLNSSVSFDLSSLRAALKLMKYRAKLLQKTIRELSKNFKNTFAESQILAKETDAIKHKRELFHAVRQRLDYKEMERNVPGSIEILAKAFTPSEPTRDRRFILSVLTILFGIAAGCSVAYLRAVTTGNIYEINELEHTLNAPLLGQLPIVNRPSRQAVEESPILSENIRMVRTAIMQYLHGRAGTAIQITSPTQGAGKTTFSILLAKSLAQCGKRVLLVDADLRNPTVASRFNIDNKPGLVYALNIGPAAAHPIRTTDMPLLSVLPAGVAEQKDLELIANGSFSACLNKWKMEFDIVLIDSSPIVPVADARILSRFADSTIMVIREAKTKKADIIEALTSLDSAGGTLMGTVFMGSGRRTGYGQYYAPDYYGTMPTSASGFGFPSATRQPPKS